MSAPLTPLVWLTLSSVGLLLSAAALLALPPRAWSEVRWLPRLLSRTTGLLAGTAGGLLIAALGWPSASSPPQRLLLLLVAGLAVLLLGVYLPGLDARQHARRRRRLAVQAIDLAGYLRLALRSSQGDVAVLQQYTTPPRRAVRDLQALLTQVLQQHRERGGSVYDVLHAAAESTACRELLRMTATLRAIMQQDRAQVDHALGQVRQELISAMLDRFQASLPRRETAVTAAAAGSLIFGLLFTILYVMTNGGQLLMTLGGM